jgi:hypothetical protein
VVLTIVFAILMVVGLVAGIPGLILHMELERHCQLPREHTLSTLRELHAAAASQELRPRDS